MYQIPDKIAEELETDEIVCTICGEPFGCGDDTTVNEEYDCWADKKYGLAHLGCLLEQG